MSKPKLALYWAAGCGGCDIAVLDIEEKILDVADFFDIVFWPCAMDFKYSDVEALGENEIDLTLFNGAI
ncbi:MAG: oxidoreductase, partial [Calditrichaeota bacterium]|nr:oxidoreductase [Calditrichota bacterium]